MDKSEALIEALEDLGKEPYSYSGRSMYGKTCVAVDVGSSGEVFRLAFELGQSGLKELRVPCTDNMGLGLVIYWPGYPWPSSKEDVPCRE